MVIIRIVIELSSIFLIGGMFQASTTTFGKAFLSFAAVSFTASERSGSLPIILKQSATGLMLNTQFALVQLLETALKLS